MRGITFFVVAAGAASSVAAINVIMSNDDGWASCNIRASFDELRRAGFNAVISSPAVGRSGAGSLDLPAVPVLTGCEWDSCPALSPAIGFNASNPRLNYVNSMPATSAKYGIETLAPKFFGGPPDLVVTGPNIGSNLGLVNQISGTIGSASVAANKGIPALAFSGASGDQISYTELPTAWSDVYARLATRFTLIMTASKPYGPIGSVVSVNYPKVDGGCTSPKYVLSRVLPAGFLSDADVTTCGSDRLPTESDVIAAGCYASVSVIDPSTKTTANATAQALVKAKLGHLLTCLPTKA
ncbi:acid phosphatase [Exidia glandulosa HHB12029]|uniref:Acid phosphatase n=1 Tax=Exidia glandulosa HHB12029 TaxID=1314781 RepID=A0A166B4L6_EXIGL|nr:acid phosphatase [Exidia glandulosa HHB12029]